MKQYCFFFKSLQKVQKFLCIRHITVSVFTVSESSVDWKLIQCSWLFQYIQYVGGGGPTSFPNAVNVFLVSVLSFGGFFMHTCFTLSISTGARTMFHQHSYLKVFSMCALSCTSANGPKLVTQHKCK